MAATRSLQASLVVASGAAMAEPIKVAERRETFMACTKSKEYEAVQRKSLLVVLR